MKKLIQIRKVCYLQLITYINYVLQILDIMIILILFNNTYISPFIILKFNESNLELIHEI